MHRYKAAEVRAVIAARGRVGALAHLVSRVWHGLVRFGNQKFTVMLIPHSERKIFNLRLSMFGLMFTGLLVAGVLVVFVSLSTDFTRTYDRFLTAERSLAASETTDSRISGAETKSSHRSRLRPRWLRATSLPRLVAMVRLASLMHPPVADARTSQVHRRAGIAACSQRFAPCRLRILL